MLNSEILRLIFSDFWHQWIIHSKKVTRPNPKVENPSKKLLRPSTVTAFKNAKPEILASSFQSFCGGNEWWSWCLQCIPMCSAETKMLDIVFPSGLLKSLHWNKFMLLNCNLSSQLAHRPFWVFGQLGALSQAVTSKWQSSPLSPWIWVCLQVKTTFFCNKAGFRRLSMNRSVKFQWAKLHKFPCFCSQ